MSAPTASSTSRIRPVSSDHPCLVCSGDHKCGRTDDGLLLCGRRQGPQAGFDHLGAAKDPTWHLYRLRDPLAGSLGPPPFDVPTTTRFNERQGTYGERLTQAQAAALRERLGLPVWVYDLLPVGWLAEDRHGCCWTFPECDGQGRVVGATRRWPDGLKRSLAGGKRGLTLTFDFQKRWRNKIGPVYCPEGASDTLTLWALGLAAIGRPSASGGVEYLAEQLRGQGRRILIVGERDHKADGSWPGRDGAMRTAEALAGLLGEEVEWTLPPSDCKDVRAWATAPANRPDGDDTLSWGEAGVKLAALLEANAQTVRPGAGSPQPARLPLPLGELLEAPPFPLDALPAPLADLAAQASEALHCPPDFVAAPLLAVAGACLGNSWRLSLAGRHVQSAALFLAVVGHPGSGKSPALRLLAEPLLDVQGHSLTELRHALEEWEKVPEPLRGKMPVAARLLVDDFTTEALVPLLVDNPKGLLVLKDELAGLINALNQYKGGRGHDRQVLLSLWAGADVVVDRKKSEDGPLLVRSPFVGVVGGIQPAVLERLHGPQTAEDGLLDRFLFAYPAARPAAAEEDVDVAPELGRAWREACYRLLAEPATLDGRGAPSFRLAALSAAARRSWRAWTAFHAEEVNDGEFPPHLLGPWSKLRGYAGRLVLVLHALRWAVGTGADCPVEVEADTVEAVVRLTAYFKAHARKVWGAVEADERLWAARRVLRWLAERPGVSELCRTDLYQSLRRTFVRPEALDGPLDLLTEHHYLERLPNQRPGRVGQRWRVNPLWRRRCRRRHALIHGPVGRSRWEGEASPVNVYCFLGRL
jgi:hypothetical protein